MKAWIVSVVLLVIGLGSGFYAAALGLRLPFLPFVFPHTEIHYSDVGDAFLVVQPKDTLHFAHRGADQDVVFKGTSPCAGGNVHQTKCTVSVPRGLYFYECAGCPDPGVAVGSSMLLKTEANHADFSRLTYATPKAPKLICAGQTAAQNGTPPTEPLVVTAAQGNVFEIYPVGDFDFSIDMTVNAGFFCTETTTAQKYLNNAHPTCTIQNAVTGPKTFQIQMTGCGNSPATVDLTVHP